MTISRIGTLALGGTVLAMLATGCNSLMVKNTGKDGEPIPTQIVTYPSSAIMYVDGKLIGKSPILVTLPQGTNGVLNGEMRIQAFPEKAGLNPQVAVFSPQGRKDRVPDRYMIDLTEPASTDPSLEVARNAETNFITSRVPWRQPSRTAKGQPVLLSPKAKKQADEASHDGHH
jgi:hypothetical protein